MRRFWKSGDRAEWPEPRAEFLQSLSDEVRSARGRVRAGGLRLAFVIVAALALLVPLSAFAGGPARSSVRDAVKAIASAVQADTSSTTSRAEGKARAAGRHDDDDDNGGGDDDDNGDHGDDDDDNGDDDYDKNCPNRHERQRALIRHQQQENGDLRRHQGHPHPGLSHQQRKRHFKAERRALREHQKAEWREFRRECKRRGDDDDD